MQPPAGAACPAVGRPPAIGAKASPGPRIGNRLWPPHSGPGTGCLPGRPPGQARGHSLPSTGRRRRWRKRGTAGLSHPRQRTTTPPSTGSAALPGPGPGRSASPRRLPSSVCLPAAPSHPPSSCCLGVRPACAMANPSRSQRGYRHKPKGNPLQKGSLHRREPWRSLWENRMPPDCETAANMLWY